MIKAKDYEDHVKHSRIDAAMLALGFVWDGEAYSSVKKATQSVKAVKNIIAAPKKRRRKTRPEWGAEFYAQIKGMVRGESRDISAEVRSAGLNAKQAQARIYQHFYSHGENTTYRYTLGHNGAVFTITRI